MASSHPTPPERPFFLHPALAGFFALVALSKLVIVFMAWHAGAHLENLDPDTWLHLVRLRELITQGDWYSIAVARDNTPFGTTTHWSRLLDVLALPIVWPSHWVMPMQQSLLLLPLWWNTLVLLCVLLPLLLSITGRLGKTPYAQGFVLAAVALHIFYFSLYSPQQFDYHTALASCAIAMIAIACRLTEDWENRRAAIGLGLVAVLGTWFSVEFLFPVFFMLLWLGLLWWRDGRLRPLWHVSGAYCFGLLAVFLLEQPYSCWPLIEHDSLSIVHITAATANFAALGVLMLVNRYCHSRLARLLAGGVMAVVLAGVLAWLFPGFWMGALLSIDPSLGDSYMWRIDELQPVYNRLGIGLLAGLYLGVAGLVYCGFQAAKRRHDMYVLLFLLMLAFTIAMTFQTRWLNYYLPMSTLVLALAVDGWISRTRADALRARWAVIILAMLPLGLMLADNMLPRTPTEARNIYAPACLQAMEEAVRADYFSTAAGSTEPQRVIVPENYGTLVLFFTPHSIVASNYHRNTQGIRDLGRFLEAQNEAQARSVIQERGINAVMLCTPQKAAKNKYPYLYAITHGADLPRWLHAVATPWDGEGLLLYHAQP